MLYPTRFLIFCKGEELSFFISYGGIPAATIFSIDQFCDFIDNPLLSFLCRFFYFLCHLFQICPFLSSDLSLQHACLMVSATYTSPWGLADLLSFIVFFSWSPYSRAFRVSSVIHSFFLSSPLHPQTSSSLDSTIDLQCLLLHCLTRLCCSRLGTCSSAVGQMNF